MASIASALLLASSLAHADQSSWMKYISNSRLLSTMSIPGTHDSGARYCGVGYSTQKWTVDEQLKNGVRFLDIRLRYYKDDLFVHHGNCYEHMTLKDVLDATHEFLANNPSETVFIKIQQEYSSASDKDFIARVQQNFQARPYVSQNRQIPYLGNARGQILIVSRVSGLEGIPWGDLNVQDDYAVWDWPSDKNKKVKEVEDQMAAAIDAHGKGDTTVYLNHLSGGTYSFPYRISDWVNPAIAKYIEKQKAIDPHVGYGIMAMDYPTNQLIDEIIQAN